MYCATYLLVSSEGLDGVDRQWAKQGENVRKTVRNTHKGAGVNRRQINMIYVVAAEDGGVESHTEHQYGDGESSLVSPDETQRDEGQSR